MYKRQVENCTPRVLDKVIIPKNITVHLEMCIRDRKMKEEAGLSSRCMPFEQEHLSDVCPCCGKPAKTMVYWGIAY